MAEYKTATAVSPVPPARPRPSAALLGEDRRAFTAEELAEMAEVVAARVATNLQKGAHRTDD